MLGNELVENFNICAAKGSTNLLTTFIFTKIKEENHFPAVKKNRREKKTEISCQSCSVKQMLMRDTCPNPHTHTHMNILLKSPIMLVLQIDNLPNDLIL